MYGSFASSSRSILSRLLAISRLSKSSANQQVRVVVSYGAYVHSGGAFEWEHAVNPISMKSGMSSETSPSESTITCAIAVSWLRVWACSGYETRLDYFTLFTGQLKDALGESIDCAGHRASRRCSQPWRRRGWRGRGRRNSRRSCPPLQGVVSLPL